jgi:hypothetical protein
MGGSLRRELRCDEDERCAFRLCCRKMSDGVITGRTPPAARENLSAASDDSLAMLRVDRSSTKTDGRRPEGCASSCSINLTEHDERTPARQPPPPKSILRGKMRSLLLRFSAVLTSSPACRNSSATSSSAAERPLGSSPARPLSLRGVGALTDGKMLARDGIQRGNSDVRRRCV